MKNNYLLVTADIILKIAIAVTVLAGLLIIVAFIHLQFNPDFYTDVLVNTEQTQFTINIEPELVHHESLSEWERDGDQVYYLNRLTTRSTIYICVYMLIKMAIFLIIMLQLNRFINSVKSYTTFHSDNVVVFRRIGFCFLILFLLQVTPFTILEMEFADGTATFSDIKWFFDLKYIIAFVFALILSEVFKEGHRLSLENELTI